MPGNGNRHRREVALFRYGLIAEALRLPPGSPERAARLRETAARSHAIPGSRRRRVAVSTLRQWMRQYERDGFDALRPKLRADRGRTRGLAPDVAELLLCLKEGCPRLPVREVISQARASGQVPEGTRLAPSTVHRLLRRAGLTGRPREPGPGPARPFAYAEAGELWMADVMHGPKAGCDPGDRRRRAKTYLIALLDDATRVVPHAAFAFTENAEAFLAVLRQAILRRGRPLRLYVEYVARHIFDIMFPVRLCAQRTVKR